METITRDALVEKLYETDGKAEIIDGEIVSFPADGCMPSRAAGEIRFRLREYEQRKGRALGGTVVFLVDLPNRRSFSPDAAFYTGKPAGMKFLEGAPIFAAEVRSENDYGPQSEHTMAVKRADYFAAGTQVVWDVDLQSDGVVRVFRDGNAEQPAAVYCRGGTAETEPALPCFTMPVGDLFV